ncbi:hypothetical protein MNBD_IGNAVI01-1056 [hydrothermal vent metagenome]|uniref:Uncharacterized protein n=1 Tax=hydrothermal vent metagenome TaxID=652676 RepID=A0A3B1C2Y0_9ZZZZ
MTHRKIWAFLLLISTVFLLSQCTSRYTQKDVEQLLSTERVTANTSDISILIPNGWHTIEANDSLFIDLWLVSKDYNSSLSLIPLHSENNKQSFSEWTSVSKLSNKMKFKKDKIEIVDDGDDVINGIQTSSYYFKVNNTLHRITIFNFKNKFYELTALDKAINHNKASQINNLEKLQTAIIQTVR